MQKTRLGISVGLLGAAIYFMGLFSGYLLAVLLAGYVLLFEENSWLRKNAVKAMSVMAVFSLLITVLNLVPNAFDFCCRCGTQHYREAVDNWVGCESLDARNNCCSCC